MLSPDGPDSPDNPGPRLDGDKGVHNDQSTRPMSVHRRQRDKYVRSVQLRYPRVEAQQVVDETFNDLEHRLGEVAVSERFVYGAVRNRAISAGRKLDQDKKSKAAVWALQQPGASWRRAMESFPLASLLEVDVDLQDRERARLLRRLWSLLVAPRKDASHDETVILTYLAELCATDADFLFQGIAQHLGCDRRTAKARVMKVLMSRIRRLGLLPPGRPVTLDALLEGVARRRPKAGS